MHEHQQDHSLSDIHRQMDEHNSVETQESQKNQKSSSTGQLTISSSDDGSEQYADSIARQVAGGAKVNLQNTSQTLPRVQARHNNGQTAEPPSGFESKLNANKGSGAPLDDNTRREMQSQMGADFSNVKIHTGPEASRMSTDVNAMAFTHGQDIFFADGNYNPQSAEGKELLAHELVHTAQNVNTIQRKDPPSETYTVKKGDTLRKIAKALDIKLSVLMKWNPGLSTNPNREITVAEIVIPSKNSTDVPEILDLRRDTFEQDVNKAKDVKILDHKVEEEKVDTEEPGIKKEEEEELHPEEQGEKKKASTSVPTQKTVADVNKQFKERETTKDNLPDHAYSWGAGIIDQLQNRVNNYEGALHIFNEQMILHASKDMPKFPWLAMFGSMAVKLLTGPIGAFITTWVQQNWLGGAAPGTPVTVGAPTVDLAKVGEILVKTPFETVLGMKADRSNFNHNLLFAENMQKITILENILNDADTAAQLAVDERYQQLRKAGGENPTEAIKYLNDLKEMRLKLQEELTTKYSQHKFVEGLTFEWITRNNNPTEKRNKPRTGFLDITMQDPLQGDGSQPNPPENWKVTKVKIHAPYPGDIMTLLQTYGSEYNFPTEKEPDQMKKGIDLATVPLPRKYLFLTKNGTRIHGWSDGPLSQYELQSGYVGKLKDDFLEKTLTTRALEKALADEKFPLDEVKSTEDMSLIKKLF